MRFDTVDIDDPVVQDNAALADAPGEDYSDVRAARSWPWRMTTASRWCCRC